MDLNVLASTNALLLNKSVNTPTKNIMHFVLKITLEHNSDKITKSWSHEQYIP